MRPLYSATIALAAFLLFSVEPMATRALLPLLGGSSSVWITALAFFQLALLLGYGYAALLERLSARHRCVSMGHVALVALATASLLGSAAANTPFGVGQPPQVRLFLLLARSIGLPFVVLSATSPLLQAWYARREHSAVPYRLFGVSNISSLVALLAYSTLMERYLQLHIQRSLWSAGFLLYAVAMVLLTIRMRRASRAGGEERVAGLRGRLTPQRLLLWFVLPAVASAQLAAVTQHLTQNIAPMPLLWVLPLAAYLLSFVLAFELPRFYRRDDVLRVLVVLLAGLGYFLAQPQVTVPILLSIVLFTAELLAAAWFLHAEVYALRPRDSTEATVFYFVLAAGGAAGTVAVAIAAPLLTRSNFDLPAAFLLTAAIALVLTWSEGWGYRALWSVGTVLGVVLLVSLSDSYSHDALLRDRNFYGCVRVVQTDLPPQAVTSRLLYNGTIEHGMQWFSEEFRRTPLTYYAPDSGVGLALEGCCPGRARRIGIIGLGAGTLAAYGRAGDSFRFYEINPLVVSVANNLFTYLRESPATITVVPGDARLSLAAEPPQHFDVLVIDAFSGDSIPVHLLTREALELYRRHLAPGGLLAFHISNQYLDLAPVLARLAESDTLEARQIDTSARESRGEFTSSWVLLASGRELLEEPEIARAAQPLATRPEVRLWTDQYSTLLPIVRWTGTP